MSASSGKTPLLNAVAQSDIDMANFKLNNLGTSPGLFQPQAAQLDTLSLSSDFFLSLSSLGTDSAFRTAIGAISTTSPTFTDSTLNQASNGDVAISSKRVTDTLPTGSFEDFRRADNVSSLWNVDITGTLQAGSVPVGRVSGLSASATTDATNATNINQGTLAKARMPATTVFTDQANTFGAFVQKFQASTNFCLVDPSDMTKAFKFDLSNISTATTRTITVGDADSATTVPIGAVSHNFLTAMNSQGVFSQAQPAFTDISGSVAASQLPNPSASTLGGIESYVAVSHQWINAISTSGVPSSTQPAFTDISGTLALSAGGTGQVTANAAANALLPAQGSNSGKFLSTDGANTSWVTVAGGGTFSSFSFVNTNGFVGTVAAATTDPALTLKLGDSVDNTKTAKFDCSNISTSTQRTINVPNANSTTVQALAAVSHQFVTAMSAQGVFTLAQPAVADLSDTKTGSGNLVLQASPTLITPVLGVASATSLTGLTGALTPNAAAGTDVGSVSLPFANLFVGTGATNVNKITSSATTATRTFTLPDSNSNSVIPDAGASNNFLTAISSGGVISKAQPAFTNISGSVAAGQMPALTGDVTTAAGAVASTLVTISKNFTISGVVTPSQITADQNNYNPAGWSTGNTLRISTDAARNITGLAGGSAGSIGLIYNVGSFNATLVAESASSTAANRFAQVTVIRPNDLAILVYDGTSSRWRANVSNFTGGTLTSELVLSASSGPADVASAGFRGSPINTHNAAYTFVLADAGQTMFHDEVTARVYTIPANASVAYPIGTTITIINNNAAGAITLSITTDTLRRGDGTAGTGSRTIAADSVAVIQKTKSTEWMIAGKFS